MANHGVDNVEPESLLPEEASGLRAGLYKTIALLLLRPPTSKALAALASTEAREQVRGLLGEDGKAMLDDLSDDADGLDQEDIREFYDLLAVPSARYLTPFESTYRDPLELPDGQHRPRLSGPAMIAVEQAYAAAGLAMEIKELPDHAGCELAFLGELCEREASGYVRGDSELIRKTRDDQRSFLLVHALQWLHAFFERLEQNARAPYLRVISRLGRMLLSQHSASLN